MCPDARRVTLMAAAACVALLARPRATQVAVIVTAGLAGLVAAAAAAWRARSTAAVASRGRAVARAVRGAPRRPAVRGSYAAPDTLAVVDAFFRTGALVFGGGHVVLRCCRAGGRARLGRRCGVLAGYGVAQAVPGPLFTFSAFLGASLRNAPKLARRHDRAGVDLRAVVPAGSRHRAVLGTPAPQHAHAGRARRRERGRRRAAARRALSPGLDRHDRGAARSGRRARRIRRAGVLARAAVGRRDRERRARLGGLPARFRRGTFHRVKTKALVSRAFFWCRCRGARSAGPYAKFFAAKSQFTMFQNASTNFGRALR